jgi:leucine dehydrogenase
MQAASLWRWGSESLAGRTVALQGCGNVGTWLARELRRAGARLVVTDVDARRRERLASEVEGRAVAPDEIFEIDADVLAPCALGSVLNDATVPRLRAEVVCGAANNQLAEDRNGEDVAMRGILYTPDYVANAGGVLSGAHDVLGWSSAEVAAKVEGIFEKATTVFTIARDVGIAPHRAADRLAASILRGERPAG